MTVNKTRESVATKEREALKTLLESDEHFVIGAYGGSRDVEIRALDDNSAKYAIDVTDPFGSQELLYQDADDALDEFYSLLKTKNQ